MTPTNGTPRPLVPTSSHLVPAEPNTDLVPSSLPLQGDEGRDEVEGRTRDSDLVPDEAQSTGGPMTERDGYVMPTLQELRNLQEAMQRQHAHAWLQRIREQLRQLTGPKK